MPRDFRATIASLSDAKTLAIAAYGESVAAYRYRILAEKTTSEDHRATFVEMAKEEQEHHRTLNRLIHEKLPHGDFVLSPDDKELVIVGPRMLEAGDEESFRQALELIYQSERRTGDFYAVFHEVTKMTDLKPLLDEMSKECFEHAGRIRSLFPAP